VILEERRSGKTGTPFLFFRVTKDGIECNGVASVGGGVFQVAVFSARTQ